MGSSENQLGTLSRLIARLILGAFLLFAGVGHLSFARVEFQAQVPSWFPADPDLVVVVSGVIEIILGLALILSPKRWRGWVGVAAALFFIAIFPGNIAQWLEGKDGFTLDNDLARFLRLLFQPVLVVWALWCTRGWAQLRRLWNSSPGDSAT